VIAYGAAYLSTQIQKPTRDREYNWAGYWGAQLKKSGRFEAEALVPVPLHPKKLRQRGFNQAATIAEGMAQELNLPVTHAHRSENVSNRPDPNGTAGPLGK
jgi:predicted amidophosphoribosyltransferase